MLLDERLDRLRREGKVSPENFNAVCQVIRYFKEKQGIDLNDYNASMMITHLCLALERASRGEDLQPLDPAVYEETTDAPNFERAVAVCRDICRMIPKLSASETEYLVMHVGVLLDKVSPPNNTLSL